MTDSDLEQRLRRTLTARADQITQSRLQPAVPPTTSVRQSLTHRIRWWMPALAAAALIAAVLLIRLPGPDPIAPTAPPASVPAPATSPVAPTLSPSASSPAARPIPTASSTTRPTTTPSLTHRTATAPSASRPDPSATHQPTSGPQATPPR